NPAFVTQAGDWWIDSVSGMIYVYAPIGVASATDMNAKIFLAPMEDNTALSTILSIGMPDSVPTCSASTLVQNITISGITWTLTGAGRPGTAGYTGYTGSMYFSGIDKA